MPTNAEFKLRIAEYPEPPGTDGLNNLQLATLLAQLKEADGGEMTVADRYLHDKAEAAKADAEAAKVAAAAKADAEDVARILKAKTAEAAKVAAAALAAKADAKAAKATKLAKPAPEVRVARGSFTTLAGIRDKGDVMTADMLAGGDKALQALIIGGHCVVCG